MHSPVQPENLPGRVLAHEHGQVGSHGRTELHSLARISGDEGLDLADALPEAKFAAQAVTGEVRQVEHADRLLPKLVHPSEAIHHQGAEILR